MGASESTNIKGTNNTFTPKSITSSSRQRESFGQQRHRTLTDQLNYEWSSLNPSSRKTQDVYVLIDTDNAETIMNYMEQTNLKARDTVTLDIHMDPQWSYETWSETTAFIWIQRKQLAEHSRNTKGGRMGGNY